MLGYKSKVFFRCVKGFIMPSRKKKKKYRDSEPEDVEMEEHQDSESSEEEITIIHENRKQRARRAARRAVERVKEEPKCRSVLFRYCLFLVVLSLGVGMVVNLYGTYGEYVTDAIFPPRVSSAAVVCAGEPLLIKNDYMVQYHHFAEDNSTGAGWAILNATQPKENLLMAWESSETTDDSEITESFLTPHMVDARWTTKDSLKVWIPGPNNCVSFIVWSI